MSRQATLLELDGLTALRFERVLAHAPERVWRALVEADQMRGWHPTPFVIDASAGTIRFRRAQDSPEMPDGGIVTLDEPRLLVHTWGEDELRWELTPHPAGCLLALTHLFADRLKAARDAAGWELCLDALAETLDGRSAGGEEGARAERDWRARNKEYERRFGIASHEATPPPPR